MSKNVDKKKQAFRCHLDAIFKFKMLSDKLSRKFPG